MIGTLLRRADDHLGNRHSVAAIDTIFLKVFPDQVADDCASNTDLDATAVAIDTCSETIAEIARLAKLSSVEYDRERSGAAKRLGIRATTLDVEVKARRGVVDVKGQGRPFELPGIEPWPEALEGAALLLEVTATIRQFVVMRDGAAEILALWIFHTHCFDCFMHSPRLAMTSPEKGCGKTTLLDVAARRGARPVDTVDGRKNLLTPMLGAGVAISDQLKAEIWLEAVPSQTATIKRGHYYDWLEVILATGEDVYRMDRCHRGARGAEMTAIKQRKPGKCPVSRDHRARLVRDL